jgi:hypothetical protein
MQHLKFIIPLCLSLFLFAACSEQEGKDAGPADTQKSELKPAADAPPLASFVGMFEADSVRPDAKSPSYQNLINVSVSSLKDGKISGYSVIAGNRQVFEGSYTPKGKAFEVEAREPGTDKHDGLFRFTLDTLAGTVKGTWTCYDATVDVPVRRYDLQRRTFRYDASAALNQDLVGMPFYDPRFDEVGSSTQEAITEDILKVNPSAQELKPADIENMFKGDLEILRNSIYARHGYSFRNRKMRYLFDYYVPWYMPVSVNVEAELSELEKKNIALLKRYEQHAEKYYDEFGR